MKKILSMALALFLGHIGSAQIVFSTDKEYKADIKVFAVDQAYKADLLVFKVNAEYKAKGNEGKWYFADADYKATKKVYFVDADYKADLRINFVDSDYKSKWIDKSKQHLMY